LSSKYLIKHDDPDTELELNVLAYMQAEKVRMSKFPVLVGSPLTIAEEYDLLVTRYNMIQIEGLIDRNRIKEIGDRNAASLLWEIFMKL
jgi:hypothetical protein